MKKNNNKKINRYLSIINQIEKIRGKNNINWMNILRIAIKNSPEETKNLMLKINNQDNKIR